jgi:hypothetical protein
VVLVNTGCSASKEHENICFHVLHNYKINLRACIICCLFIFYAYSLGVLAFYGIQQVAQAGLVSVLFRVMQE